MRSAIALPLLCIIAALLVVGSAFAATVPKYNTTYNTSQWEKTYNYMVNITKSSIHKPTYITPFNRPANFTINYSRTPKELQGAQPQIKRPVDLTFDIKRNNETVRLDPRTCPNDIAYCYQLLEHQQNRTTFGKNYTAVSSYILPEKRIQTFVCIGNDTACVASATNCFCPTLTVNPPPQFKFSGRECAETRHLCMNSYGTFALCEGNLSSCLERYDSCGCGPYSACVAAKQTCVNKRNQLTLCKGAIADCIKEYGTCFCGGEMFLFQQGCTTQSHACKRGNQNITCYGQFAACAVKYDKCDC